MTQVILSGLLSAITLPTAIGPFRLPSSGFLAWVTVVPFYLALKKASGPREAFQKGFLFGAAYYSLSLYWIFIAMHTYGDVSAAGSFFGVALVVVFLSLYVGGAVALADFLSRRGGLPLALLFPIAWVVQDFVRTYFPFGGFPWASLAYTQSGFLTLLQLLDLTGVSGITFLLLFTNALLGEVILSVQRKRRPPLKLAVGWVSIFAVVLFYGRMRLESVRKDLVSRRSLQIAMIQGDIPQEEKWLEEKIEEIIARHLALTEGLETSGPTPPDLIIWPEAAYPAVIPPDVTQIDLLKELRVPLLMGVVTYDGMLPEDWPPPPDDKNFALHNSAVRIDPGGLLTGRYDKNHLVPMGEYVPLGRLLFFLNKIVPSISSFSPGKELTLMQVKRAGDNRPVKFGVTICYEDLFPGISRGFVRKGADFLANLTNDAWYERSSALFQHFDFSRFRAIENRRAMVRATNTGITGFFSPTGEVISEAPIFKEAVLKGSIPVGGVESFYSRFGDLFAWGCVVTLGLLSMRRRRIGSYGS